MNNLSTRWAFRVFTIRSRTERVMKLLLRTPDISYDTWQYTYTYFLLYKLYFVSLPIKGY